MTEKPGDLIKVKTNDSTHIGKLMPNDDTNTIVIKLESGYNIGIDKKKIKQIDIIEKYKPVNKISTNNLKFDNNKKTIVILHTGGTIASKVDYETGGVSAKFSAQDLIEMIPEIEKIANIKTELIANMMSEDMSFVEHQKIAKAVFKNINNGNIDGVIIGHGTDTLGYTAASISFMLENLNLPVLIVGSQRSSDRGSTDAVSNLICAAKFIEKTDYVGVAVCMHNSSDDTECVIIPGTKARKLHTSRRDAFKTVNDSPIAIIDYKTGKIKYQKKDYPKKINEGINKNQKTKLLDKIEPKVGILKTHPNMNPSIFEAFAKTYKGIIIEGTGLGHGPFANNPNNEKNFEILKKYIKNGGIVGITSQCIFGRVNPNVYSKLRKLNQIGCIYCEDMLPETTFIKLAWLLGQYPNNPEKVKELLPTNLRGEIKDRLMPDDFI